MNFSAKKLSLVALLIVFLFLHFFKSTNVFYFTDAYYFSGAVQKILETGQLYPSQTNFVGGSIDKPPLLFWLGSLSAKCFGFSHLSLRLPVIFFALACLVLWLGFLHRQKQSWAASALSVFLISTSFSFLAVSREFDPEIIALFFNLGIVLAAYLWTESFQKRWVVLACIFSVLELMTKGGFLIVSVIPSLAWFAHCWFKKGLEWRKELFQSLKALKGWIALFVFLLLVGVGWLMQSDPQMLQYMFVKGEINKNYLQLGFNWEVLVYMLILIVPWSFFVSGYWIRPKPKDSLNDFFKVLIGSVLLFFVFFTSRVLATNYYLILAFPVSFWIANSLLHRLHLQEPFRKSQIFDLICFGILIGFVGYLLCIPETGENMVFQKYGAGIFILLAGLVWILFSFFPRKGLLALSMGLYLIGLGAVINNIPIYQAKYEYYRNLIAYFEKHPDIQKVYLVGSHHPFVFPSMIRFYLPKVELDRSFSYQNLNREMEKRVSEKKSIWISTETDPTFKFPTSYTREFCVRIKQCLVVPK